MSQPRPPVRSSRLHSVLASLGAIALLAAIAAPASADAPAGYTGYIAPPTNTVASLSTLRAQSKLSQTDLLAVSEGRWAGTCTNIGPGADGGFQFSMERIVKATDENEFTWTIIYQAPGFPRDVRDYTMRRSPDTPGKFILDENNGVLITHYFFNEGLLASEFQVGNVRLFTRETFAGNQGTFEIIVTSTAPDLESGPEGFPVDSFRVLSMQTCNLELQTGGNN